MTKKKFWPIMFVLLLGIMFCLVSYGLHIAPEENEEAEMGESERPVTEAEVPARALAALKMLAGKAKFTEFAEEIEYGHTFYEGSFKSPDGRNIDCLVTSNGDLVEVEEELRATNPLDDASRDKVYFLQALIIVLRAGINYGQRYAALARKLAEKAKGKRNCQ